MSCSPLSSLQSSCNTIIATISTIIHYQQLHNHPHCHSTIIVFLNTISTILHAVITSHHTHHHPIHQQHHTVAITWHQYEAYHHYIIIITVTIAQRHHHITITTITTTITMQYLYQLQEKEEAGFDRMIHLVQTHAEAFWLPEPILKNPTQGCKGQNLRLIVW